RNHPALMDHLIAKHDVARRLQDLIAVVVYNRDHGTEQSARDTSVIDMESIVGILFAAPFSGQALTSAGFLAILLRFGRKRRKPSIRQIDNDRIPARRLAAFGPV